LSPICEYEGLSAFETDIPGVKILNSLKNPELPSDWHGLAEYWEPTIKQIAEDFVSGEASVSPVKPNVCSYCEQSSFCRVTDEEARCAR